MPRLLVSGPIYARGPSAPNLGTSEFAAGNAGRLKGKEIAGGVFPFAVRNQFDAIQFKLVKLAPRKQFPTPDTLKGSVSKIAGIWCRDQFSASKSERSTPTPFQSGVFAIDPDGPKGMAKWSEIIAQNGGVIPPAHAHRTPGGGSILFSSGMLIAGSPSSPGKLKGTGIDVRAHVVENAIYPDLGKSRGHVTGSAPSTAAQAAKIILDGVKADRWRHPGRRRRAQARRARAQISGAGLFAGVL